MYIIFYQSLLFKCPRLVYHLWYARSFDTNKIHDDDNDDDDDVWLPGIVLFIFSWTWSFASPRVFWTGRAVGSSSRHMYLPRRSVPRLAPRCCPRSWWWRAGGRWWSRSCPPSNAQAPPGPGARFLRPGHCDRIKWSVTSSFRKCLLSSLKATSYNVKRSCKNVCQIESKDRAI